MPIANVEIVMDESHLIALAALVGGKVVKGKVFKLTDISVELPACCTCAAWGASKNNNGSCDLLYEPRTCGHRGSANRIWKEIELPPSSKR